jgi:hypothetical protein
MADYVPQHYALQPVFRRRKSKGRGSHFCTQIYFGTAHDFADATANFTFLTSASRFTSRIALPIAARISGSVGNATLRFTL